MYNLAARAIAVSQAAQNAESWLRWKEGRLISSFPLVMSSTFFRCSFFFGTCFHQQLSKEKQVGLHLHFLLFLFQQAAMGNDQDVLEMGLSRTQEEIIIGGSYLVS